MFTSVDEGKKLFVEKTRIERQKRERERIEKQISEKQTQAALHIQKWWHGRPQHERLWAWWDNEYMDNNNNNTNSATLMDVYCMVGQYCLFSRRQSPGPQRLAFLCKRLSAKCSVDQSSAKQVPFYTLLMDKRYRQNTMDMIGVVMKQCLLRICTNDNSNQLLDHQLYMSGPELTTLLFYLNPSAYKPVQHPLDHNHTLERNDMTAVGLCILQSTLDGFFDDGDNHGDLLRDACIQRVERLVKLENRSKQRGKPLDKENTKTVNSIKLWLTTVTRILLFPLQNAADTMEMSKAATYIWNYLLTVPLLSQFVSTMVLDPLRKWTLGVIHPSVTKNNNDQTATTKVVGGNGYLFLMANLVDLYQEKFMDHQEREVAYHLMDIVMHLVSLATPFYSDRQRSPYSHYHPIFKWSCCSWGDQIDAPVYELVIQNQMATLWSRCFMDQLLEPILKFRAPCSPSSSMKINKVALNTRRFLSGKKRGDTGTNATVVGMDNDNRSVPVINSKDMAEFSMNTQLMFSMYSQLGSLFTQQRKIILARIAFTPGLMSQLWLVMNHFGPQGNMIIYLDAARKNPSNIEKEPLIDVLKVFCEACSLVFLTLDDIDIFQKETPFALSDLLDLGRFLNTFYFALVQQSSNSSTTVGNNSEPNGLHSSNALHAFQAAKRLLLQLYDLDNRHPFCPPDHWLLVSDPMMSKQSLLRLVFSSPFSKDNNPPEASQFLAQVRQGDVIPMRILQLMPHTIPFTTRLHIFRDLVQLDRESNMYISATQTICIRRQHVLEDGFRALSRQSTDVLKGRIRVTFVNELGLEEAGIDQGGPFKDFVTLLISEVFEPKYGLFSCTAKTNLFYPATNSPLKGSNYIHLFEFIGKMIGKAIYEGILLDCSFAVFLLAKILGRNVFLEALQELDEDVWRNLIFLKHYEGNAEDLGLTFAMDEKTSDSVVTTELKYHGQHIGVTNDNKLEYVYLMADYKLNQRARDQTNAFIQGFRSIISANWIKVFSPPELQRVISGEDVDFDVPDLRRHTQYQNGYFEQHPIIKLLWQVVQEFSSDEKRAFLKFVTSCPKPPLGGFSFLEPPFTIRMISPNEQSIEGMGLVRAMLKLNTNSDKLGRLPSSSTCFNLLKLPAYTKKSLLREKLHYAIHSNTGFELS